MAAAPASAEAFSQADMATIIAEPSSMQPKRRPRLFMSRTCGMKPIRKDQKA